MHHCIFMPDDYHPFIGYPQLFDSFKKLGLSSDMINKYVDIIMDFAQSEGGQQTMSLLKNALL